MILAQLPSVLLGFTASAVASPLSPLPASPCHRSLFFRLDKARFTNLQVTILFHGALNKQKDETEKKRRSDDDGEPDYGFQLFLVCFDWTRDGEEKKEKRKEKKKESMLGWHLFPKPTLETVIKILTLGSVIYFIFSLDLIKWVSFLLK